MLVQMKNFHIMSVTARDGLGDSQLKLVSVYCVGRLGVVSRLVCRMLYTEYDVLVE
jgi:hypothetical protein